jgi:prepilin-type N-terminal cleavage/methylation domain-containing protein
MKTRNQGFTILELLVMIVIIGIVTALAFGAVNAGKATRELREGQTMFSQALERSRTLVKRHNYGYLLTIAADKKSFVLSARNVVGVAVANSAPDISGTLPTSVTLEVPTGSTFDSSKALFRAPFARIQTGGAPLCFLLKHTTANLQTAVDLVGVTGKVVTRATSNATACN